MASRYSATAVALLLLVTPAASRAESYFSCKRDFADLRELAGSEASFDFYHGLAYLGGAAGIQLGASPVRRWSRNNDFDTGIRKGLRLGATGAREGAALASDVGLGLSAGVLPLASIGVFFHDTRDCVETWDMFSDVIESLGLTLFVAESVKLASGRNRPYTEECGPGPDPDDAQCSSEKRHRSFFSGHASLAAAGAGLTCSFAFRREVWGSSTSAKAFPCGLGIAAALTSGVMRISADRHWGSDVLVGFLVGALIGSFDTWGPLDLLKFSTRDATGRTSARGIVLPQAGPGHIGARISLVF